MNAIHNLDTAAKHQKVIQPMRMKDTIEVVLEDLKPHNRYVLVVQAFNSMGPGPSSPTITAETLEDSKKSIFN